MNILTLLLAASCWAGIQNGGPARTQTLWLPLTTTPTPGVAAGSAAWTFTRADAVTCASYINSAGIMAYAPKNEPRFDYDPVTLKALGYLSEGSRTNKVPDSGAMIAGYTQYAMRTPAATDPPIVAPDNTSATYYVIPEDSATNNHGRGISYNRTSATPQVLAVYAKAGGRTWVALRIGDGSTGAITRSFNLATGALGTAAQQGSASHWWESSATMYQAPNGWWRCIIVSGTPTGTATYPQVFSESGDNNVYRAGDNSSSLFVFGMQVEDNAAFPSSYIPTTTAAVTRAADNLVYAFTGNMDANTGTIMVTFGYRTPQTINARIVGTYSGAAYAPLFAPNGGPQCVASYDGTVYYGPTAASLGLSDGSMFRACIAYGSGVRTLYANATPVASALTTGFPLTTLPIGEGATFSPYTHIRDVRIFSQALTAREIATLQTALGAP